MTLTRAVHTYLTDLSAKDKPWDRHKSNAVVIRDYFQAEGKGKYAARMDECARVLEMAAITTDTGEAIFKLKHTRFCRVRLCPVCQWRKTLKWSSRLQQGLPKLLEDYPKHRWIQLNLTVPNCDLEELRLTLDRMNQAFVRLTKLKDYPGIGWLKSLEITRNEETNQAHPHFHILMMVSSSYFSSFGYLKQSDWCDLWARAMRFPFTPVVHVKAVKEREHNRSILDAIVETMKYMVKEDDLKYSSKWLVELSKQVHLRRSVTLGGVFRDYFRDENEAEDLIRIGEGLEINREELDDFPSFDFGFNERKWRYLLRQIEEKDS